ncbi:hypothetical protein ACIQMR_17105 [Streptomyces sp. NPDC091376]|uniref:hypothetical protein n=1 Tax=Streptomyces sp. NPDC091376 TaxID=3365994 RepID=UPI003800BE7A
MPTLVGLASSHIESLEWDEVVEWREVLDWIEVVDSTARLSVPGAAATVEVERKNGPPTTSTMSADTDRALARHRPERPVGAVVDRSSSKGRSWDMALLSPR